jgi:FkbM family methyltransferase
MSVHVTECRLSNDLVFRTAPGVPLMYMIHEVFVEETYTPGGVQDWVRPGATVVDLGANIGVFALFAAAVHPSVRVIAAEPSPPNLALLRENAALNRMGNVAIHAVAAAGRTGQRHLRIEANGVCNSLCPAEAPPTGDGAGAEVEAMSLADLFARAGVDHCHLLKVDIEGSEYETLFAAPPALLARVDAITAEYHDDLVAHDGAELREFLRRHGFATRLQPSSDRPGTGMLYARRRHDASPAG